MARPADRDQVRKVERVTGPTVEIVNVEAARLQAVDVLAEIVGHDDSATPAVPFEHGLTSCAPGGGGVEAGVHSASPETVPVVPPGVKADTIFVTFEDERAWALRDYYNPAQARDERGRWTTTQTSLEFLDELLGDALVIHDEGTYAVKRHLGDLALMPAEILRRLRDRGVTWHLGARPMTEFEGNEEWRGVQPGGWPDGSTWDDVAGVFSSADKTVYAGEGLHGTASLVLHETGHAIWQELGLAGDADLSRGHARALAARKLEAYFRQSDGRGRNEFLAETIALRLKHGRSAAAALADWEYVDWLDEQLGLRLGM